MKVDPKSSTCCQGSPNAGQPNARQIPHPAELLEDNREMMMGLSRETQNEFWKEPQSHVESITDSYW